ncbi:uncharacterized protein [Dermacentor andersoni]|uniref:uncharacterized protein n=1 Tax=Dermacentor andersoni TaxID=34620 RepID=UPI002415A843|nr:uncharacterized protein LOC126530260 [Dermacentor andersoni]
MNILGLALTASLILMTNGALTDNMKEALSRDVLWVKYRSYIRTNWGKSVNCEYFSLAKSKKQDQYIIKRSYNLAGQWKNELLTGYVSKAGTECPGSVLELMSSVIQTHERYCLVYWNSKERCAVMKPTRNECEMFVGNKATGTPISNCTEAYDRLCGSGKYDVYDNACLPFWKQQEEQAARKQGPYMKGERYY